MNGKNEEEIILCKIMTIFEVKLPFYVHILNILGFKNFFKNLF